MSFLLDGVVHATTPTRVLRYLGWVDGVFGVLETTGWFNVLGGSDPMILRTFQTDVVGFSAVFGEGDQAWVATGPHTSRRVKLPPGE